MLENQLCLLHNLNSTSGVKNYPFCTIEPNIGKVEIKDERLDLISQISFRKKNIINLSLWIFFGLVKGASKGEGLGNKFLSNLSQVDAIIHW